MGCCASSNRSSSHSPSSPSKDNDPRSSISRAKSSENRAPPPVEEETVKEVLSETPKWKLSVAKFEAEKPGFDKFKGESKELEEKPFHKAVEEISEVSEVCSLSESVSTLTTVTDRREEDEEEETRRRRINGSPARIHRNRSFSGERRDKTPGKSPARRSDQSPGKRNVGSARVVAQSRDQMGNGVTRNQPLAGQNSGRRSRSPATRIDSVATRSVVGRSPSARRTNNSPARARTGAPEIGGRKMENSTVEGKWPPSSTANESLENPLVSLECFIFL